jgi:hypothetical protein
MKCNEKKKIATLEYAKEVCKIMEAYHNVKFYPYRCQLCGAFHTTKLKPSDHNKMLKSKRISIEKRRQFESEYWEQRLSPKKQH